MTDTQDSETTADVYAITSNQVNPSPPPLPEHLGGAYVQGDSNTIMPDVWGYLLVKYGIKTMVDIGCGYGHAMEWFSKYLVHSIGFDGDPEAVNKNRLPGHAFVHDFTLGEPRDGIIKEADFFDLAWSSEFLEHVEEKYMANYMAVFRRCRYACVTHAEPKQPGHHHVNCEDDDYWIQKFADLRSTDRWGAGWGRRTLMFFRRL
jgi:SAM-dependent methyltransferase